MSAWTNAWSQDKPSYPPGSREAALSGCICDPVLNNYGAGEGVDPDDGETYWGMQAGCPFHEPLVSPIFANVRDNPPTAIDV